MPSSQRNSRIPGVAAHCRFTGYVAATSAAVRSVLGAPCIVGVPVVADLSLGSWQAMSVARQLAGQLGLELPESRASRYLALSRAGLSYADLVSYGIDMESLGHRMIDTALDLARRFGRIAREAPVTPVVIAPRFGAGWEDDDIVFLTVLARELQRTSIVLVCCDPVPPALPAMWSVAWQSTRAAASRPGTPDALAWLPQVVPEALASRGALGPVISDHVRLPTGWIVVAPETRREPRTESRLAWDRFARAAGSVSRSLAVYGQYHGNNLHVDTAAMAREAWLQFADGGAGVALRYMHRVESCETSMLARAVAQAQNQGMRIAQLQFAEAAEQAEPGPGLPSALQSFLLQSQGWGLVHTERADRARELLRRARALLGSEDDALASREYLYLLNILALAEIRCGDAPAALRLEQHIEACLDRRASHDHALRYVNAINQARIYKRLGDWTRSAAYYDRAFAVTWGLRSESDLVYSNICRAALCELQQRPAAALMAWIRAALHWLASSRPEALSFRIAQAVAPGLPIYGPASQRLDWVDDISAALLQKLSAAARACGRAPRGPVRMRCPSFARIEDAAAPPRTAIAGDGWSLFAAAGETARRDRGEADAQLRAWLGGWIASAAAAEDVDCYVVDSRGGREMATSRRELIESCARRGVHSARYDGEVIEIDDALAHRIELESTLDIAPGVDDISEAAPCRVRFKRYREPRPLADPEIVLVSFARRSAEMCEVRAGCAIDVLACLEPLERAGVVGRTWRADA